jgi:hypothetical protein
MDWIQLRASQAGPGEHNEEYIVYMIDRTKCSTHAAKKEKGRIQIYREVQKWSTSSNNHVLQKLGFVVSLQHPLLHAQETHTDSRDVHFHHHHLLLVDFLIAFLSSYRQPYQLTPLRYDGRFWW